MGAGVAAKGNGRPRRWVYALLLAAATVAAYWGTFSVPLFFDDLPAIVDNPSIRHLGDLGAVLSPPSSPGDDSGASGRPLINLSFAVNYALGGLNPRGYHAVNLAVHVGSVLLLFGIVGRTLRRNPTAARAAPGPDALAFAAALLWAVHPLLTESVTCAVQRTESLMGLCYLATLYGFVRYAEREAAGLAWAVLAFLCCLLGMAAKEVMVTAPVIVLLYDRTFVSGGFREALRRHGRVHAALGASWALLALLVLRNGSSRGFGHGAGAWSYLLTQCRAVVLYLRLSVWPHPLAIDYGTALAKGLADVWPQALLLSALLACVGWCLVTRPALGFVGAWFFLILAPSSSFVPLAQQTIAEHRMYLPLAAVAVLAVCAGARLLRGLVLPSALLLAAALGGMSWERNQVFRDPAALWADAVRALPSNERAHNNLGFALFQDPARLGDAVAEYREALRLRPDYPRALANLGNALVRIPGRLDEAIEVYEKSLRLQRYQYETHYNLACALQARGIRGDEVIAQLEEAVSEKPDYAEALANLGLVLQSKPGRVAEAIAREKESLRLKPGNASVNVNLALAILWSGGAASEAEAYAREALRIDPENRAARDILARMGDSGP